MVLPYLIGSYFSKTITYCVEVLSHSARSDWRINKNFVETISTYYAGYYNPSGVLTVNVFLKIATEILRDGYLDPYEVGVLTLLSMLV